MLFCVFFCRGYNARKFYVKRTKAIVLLQSCVRRMYAKRELKKLKVCLYFLEYRLFISWKNCLPIRDIMLETV